MSIEQLPEIPRHGESLYELRDGDIFYEMMGGEDLQDAITRMIDLAKKKDVTVKTIFNDARVILVNKDSTLDQFDL